MTAPEKTRHARIRKQPRPSPRLLPLKRSKRMSSKMTPRAKSPRRIR